MAKLEKDKAREFWIRVDALRGQMQLKDLCALAELDANKVMHNRSDMRLMNCMDTLALARVLHVSMEYLLVGYDTNPIKAVDHDLVNAFQRADDVTKEMVYRVLNVPYEKNVKEEETSFIS